MLDSTSKRILFHTGNKSKFLEAREYMISKGIKLELLSDYESEIHVIEPQMNNFNEVATSKLRQVLEQIGNKFDDDWMMVEDSGLLIDELGGFPGPYSSYVYSKIGPNGILRLMDGVETRSARYTASISVWDGNKIRSFEGFCEGVIAVEPRGNRGFGYDPIFIPIKGDGRTFSEMTKLEKSRLSHRANALNILSDAILVPSI
ncbi:MAG: RdgB/HAM1 family non-canonical purine NTP pyrophosphatase [Candidatus Thermoplasmatota archaeon]|nr:RdgB/HAM1 family non-canonical purine NTP pyrophosphatase [Candidatus Thermoplasmatota archaeon]